MSRVYVGTSGWTYDSWRGPFYPEAIARNAWLAHYVGRFPSVEINGAFYRTPSLEAVRAWADTAPTGFRFAWKASKFITHWKRLSEQSDTSIALMVTRLEALGRKVGPVLFQLPPRFAANHARLAAFLAMLPDRYRYAFEFRHASWYSDETYRLLRAHNVALCLSDHHDAPAPWVVTARHVYVRGHGPAGDYRDHYGDAALRDWAKRITQWTRQRRTVYVYFDNDQKSAAPRDAARLCRLLDKAGA